MKKILPLIFFTITILLNGQDNNINPDISVSGIKLQDPVTLESKIPNFRTLMSDFSPFSKVYLTNKDETEIATLTFQPGSNAHVVAEIHITPKDFGPVKGLKTTKFDVDRFITESNIKLYISKNALIKIKGTNFKIEKSDDKEIIKYKIDNIASSDFLKHYCLPEYYADYTFDHDQLIKIDFGFVYP